MAPRKKNTGSSRAPRGKKRGSAVRSRSIVHSPTPSPHPDLVSSFLDTEASVSKKNGGDVTTDDESDAGAPGADDHYVLDGFVVADDPALLSPLTPPEDNPFATDGTAFDMDPPPSEATDVLDKSLVYPSDVSISGHQCDRLPSADDDNKDDVKPFVKTEAGMGESVSWRNTPSPSSTYRHRLVSFLMFSYTCPLNLLFCYSFTNYVTVALSPDRLLGPPLKEDFLDDNKSNFNADSMMSSPIPWPDTPSPRTKFRNQHNEPVNRSPSPDLVVSGPFPVSRGLTFGSIPPPVYNGSSTSSISNGSVMVSPSSGINNL
ncbi:hypothetical protein F5880DRAFT_62199 [Lentinula raphanica]|nr:hypothetical protein F5880DRAFT_62199 [Lentinula raphanica]